MNDQQFKNKQGFKKKKIILSYKKIKKKYFVYY